MSQSLSQLAALAHSAYGSGRIEEAARLCQQALSLDPRFPPANFMLAVIDAQAGRRRDAITRLRLVVNTDPNAFEALEWLANLLREEGEFSESIYLCGHMIRLRPRFPGGYSTLGMCQISTGKPLEAIVSLQQAIALSPGIPVFHYHLGRALERAEKAGDAAKEFRIAISLAPKVSDSYEALGELLFRSGKRDEAIELLREAAEAAPTANVLLLLASALADEGRPQEAESFLRRSIELDPDFATAREIFGQALEVLGRFDEAVEQFERAIVLSPAAPGPYFGLTRCRKIGEDDRTMIRTLEAMTLEPGRDDEERRKIHYALGKAYSDLAEFERALEHYDQANRYAFSVQLHGKVFDAAKYQKWIDRLIQTYSPAFIAGHRGDSQEGAPILIVGMIRSGTTLTEQIVSSHPRVGAGGEVKFWTDDERTQLIQRMTHGIYASDEVKAAGRAYLTQLEDLAPGFSMVTDKMPLNFMALGLIWILFPEARIIHCRRSPIDNCLSIYLTPYDKGAEFCYERRSIVSAYKEYSRLMAHWRQTLPADRFLEVDYEDLVGDTEAVARRMIDFCGLEWDDACLRHEENVRAVRTPSRWQVRQPIYSSSVERWRKYEPWLGEFRELLSP